MNCKSGIFRQCKFFALPFCGDFLNNTKQKYINSAVLLLVSSVLVKAISAVYKIPLTAYIGATGRGYFNIAYNLYMPVHALIMGAFPIALSHLVSKYNAKGDHAKIYSLKRASGILFLLWACLDLHLWFFLQNPMPSLFLRHLKVFIPSLYLPRMYCFHQWQPAADHLQKAI